MTRWKLRVKCVSISFGSLMSRTYTHPVKIRPVIQVQRLRLRITLSSYLRSRRLALRDLWTRDRAWRIYGFADCLLFSSRLWC